MPLRSSILTSSVILLTIATAAIYLVRQHTENMFNETAMIMQLHDRAVEGQQKTFGDFYTQNKERIWKQSPATAAYSGFLLSPSGNYYWFLDYFCFLHFLLSPGLPDLYKCFISVVSRFTRRDIGLLVK